MSRTISHLEVALEVTRSSGVLQLYCTCVPVGQLAVTLNGPSHMVKPDPPVGEPEVREESPAWSTCRCRRLSYWPPTPVLAVHAVRQIASKTNSAGICRVDAVSVKF